MSKILAGCAYRETVMKVSELQDVEYLTHEELTELRELCKKSTEPEGERILALMTRLLIEVGAQRDRASIVRNLYAVDRYEPRLK